MNQETTEKTESAAQNAVRENLDSLEAQVDETVETAVERTRDTVHEIRDEAERIAERTIRSVERNLAKAEAFFRARPYILFGLLVVLAYVFAGRQGRRSA
ncbi:MAG TPA: hypothetical protein VJ746_20800 [Nitrospira sp.]|nr:hypothetical protein [Nitrospira sp.]